MNRMFPVGPVDPYLVERIAVIAAGACTAGCVARLVVWLVAVHAQRRQHARAASSRAASPTTPRPPSIGERHTPAVQQGVEPIDVTSRVEPTAVMQQPTPRATTVHPPYEFVVRLLGPIDVIDRDGRAVAIERTKSTELLAWLALHRRGATRSSARAAIWSAEVSDATLSNVVSGARRALSRHLPDVAADWLGAPHAELLQLDPRVVSDLDLFQRHLLDAERSSGAARARALGSALALVRGAPLLGSNYRWADDEALTSSLTLSVVDAARDLAESALRSGDDMAVLRAAAAGLSVLPGHEELIALRLRAHHAAGRHAALRSEWEAYSRAALADGWVSGPAPWIAELVDELLATRAVR